MMMLLFLSAGLFNPSEVSAQFFFMENEDVGKKVKDFTLKVVDGEEVNLEKYRDGKKTIVFFWATWCPHCRAALEELNKNKDTIEKKGIKIAPVDVGEKEEVVNKYLEKNDIKFSVFLDEESEVAETYELIGVPTFYFVNEDGIVTDVDHSLPKDLEKSFSRS
jgi:peroxiredoxin